jgi:hypothetical protein
MSEMSSDRYDPSFWVRSQVAGLPDRLDDGRTDLCPHLADPAKDQHAFAVWAPELLLCGDCLQSVLAAPAGPCDRCGERPATRLNDYVPREGRNLTLYFRLCDDCQAREWSL